MIEINNLSSLNLFSNFETFNYGDKTIILYDDHRCILTALFEARKLGIISNGTNLITFDRHDDARKIHPNSMRIINSIVASGFDEMSSRDFKNFVEYDISENDDDWVRVAFELNLIHNIVNIGNIENSNIMDFANNIYKSSGGTEHKAYVIGHIFDELNTHGGSLGDMALYQENKDLHEIFGYNLIGGEGFSDDFQEFVLDFDLDCFTTNCQNKVYAWPESIFAKEYNNETSGYFMYRLIQRAKFITICREPSYCGGIGESNKILSYLDKYFFRGCIGTKPVS